jgi:3-methyl-2-oxobutanoate hydroxymethyltransferase
MEQAGASALLLEAVTNQVAAAVTERTRLPVIGCVSGPNCDGQVLVLHDVLGYTAGHRPSAVKAYADLRQVVTDAAARYAGDILKQDYPGESHGITMPAAEWDKLRRRLEAGL